MKILHLLPSNKYSGAENVVCQIMSFFKDTNRLEMLYCSPDGPIRSALAERNIPFSPLVKFSVQNIRKKLYEVQPDIVHAHDMKATVIAAMACGHIPLISHIHNNNFDSQKITLKSVIYFLSAQKASHIFWVSKSSFEGYYFHKGLEMKSTVLYNVIDPIQLKKAADQAELKTTYDIVYIGRITYQKNPQRLIDVLGQIIEARPKTHCAIVGSGDMENEIRKEVSAKRLTSNITFLGFQANPYGILKNARVMIMTSRWEGTPMCALEAMALGVPIVSTPTDGLCELVDDGVTGYLSDNDEIIVQNCLRIVNDAQLPKRCKS